MHLSLATTSTDASGASPSREYCMTSTDPLTVIGFFVAAAGSAAYTAGVPLRDDKGNVVQLRGLAASVRVTDPSTYVGYQVLRGGAPSAVWVDATTTSTNSAGAGTSAALGTTKLSVAPVDAASPIATGTNDPRVCTAECPLDFGADCSLVEQTIWVAPVACTPTAIYIETGSKAITASNSNYITVTAKQRPTATPASPATMIATTTKAADLNATVAFTEKSLGSLSNTTFLAGDKITLTSATTGTITGGVPGFARITYTVP